MRDERKVLFLMLIMCLVGVATPLAWAAEGRQALEPTRDARAADELGRGSAGKVTICHHPPGNPSNPQTITVGQAAVPAHLAHGDALGACPPACSGVPSPVPKTGQTECWDQEGIPISCAGTGQDGELQKGVSADPRFTDNLDGTVKDNLTGLIWLKNTQCLGVMDWSSALSAAINLSAASAPPACSLTDDSLAGSWRLPNLKELLSLTDYGQTVPALPPGHPFSGVTENGFWSSSAIAYAPEWAWWVGFGIGNTRDSLKSDSAWVWPVRGGQ